MQQSVLPNGFSLNILHTWRLVSQPRNYADWLRKQYGELASISYKNTIMVVVLTPEGARQVFSSDPDGYDAFWKTGFSGVAGPGSL